MIVFACTDVKDFMGRTAEQMYQEAGLLDQTAHQTAGLRVVDALLKSSSGSIDFAKWNSLVPNPQVLMFEPTCALCAFKQHLMPDDSREHALSVCACLWMRRLL